MNNEWAQAQKDATHLSNFLRALAKAGEVFTHVAEAEVELARLRASLTVAEKRVEDALSDAVQAEADSRGRVAEAKSAAKAEERELDRVRRGVISKRGALEEEAERDRLAFVKLTGEREEALRNAQAEHEVIMNRLVAAEEAARASLEAVNKQREKMIADLQHEETPDVTPA